MVLVISPPTMAFLFVRRLSTPLTQWKVLMKSKTLYPKAAGLWFKASWQATAHRLPAWSL